KFGTSTMQRIVESETPMLSPFEIFTDCTQAHLDTNRDWLQPRFQDPNSGLLTITIQSFLIRQNGLTILVDSCSGNDKAARVLPVFAAGQADLVGDEHAVASEISVELAPGHTPGQMMVRLGSGRDQAILSADLMHHPLQVRYPEWSTRFCTDPVQARTTRINFFNEYANTGRLIFPAHFPSPTGGTIERDGKDFRF